MSLQRALDRLSCDRGAETSMRHIVALFRRHPGEWLDADTVSSVVGVRDETAEMILALLTETLVIDSSDAPKRYRYGGDRLTDLEIDRFLRRSEVHRGALQNNVERFRERYGR